LTGLYELANAVGYQPLRPFLWIAAESGQQSTAIAVSGP